ncbi:MAG: hypothetical protein SFX73_10150 [Kofleriaceae bacterium]|nr:hypothetical protein [Kofleriaceae bacterium]
MRLSFVPLSTLALCACFSKPGFRGNGDAGVDADGMTDAQVDGAADAPSDAPIDAPVDAPQPVALTFTQISAGHHHACGIDTSTRLWCWGDNQEGQLGERADFASGNPGLVSTTPAMQDGWTWISAGYRHTCGIRANKVYCWGDNDGQQSDATMTSNATGITEVVLASAPVKVFAGASLSCAILADQSAHCWGDHDLGASQAQPAGVRPFLAGTTFTSFALAYDHGCALAVGGTVRCWGDNTSYELGQTSVTQAAYDAAVTASHATPFKAITVTNDVSCGTTTDDDLVCWGSVGRGHFPGGPTMKTANHTVDATRAWGSVAIGEDHGCALTTAGEVFCYGPNLDGATGGTTFQARSSIPGTPQLAGVSQLVSGDGFACALDQATATLKCWGGNRTGELGNREVASSMSPRTVPLAVGATDVVRQVIVGDNHTCALVGPATGGATAYCWGRNLDQQIATPMTLSEPLPVASSMLFTQLASGGHHVCGLGVGGADITCRGDNTSLQLGANPATDGTRTIAKPPGTAAWTYVAAGSSATCAIADEKLSCWGAIPGVGGSNLRQDYGFAGTAQWKWTSIAVGSDFAVGTTLEGTRPRIMSFGKQCAASSASGPAISPSDPSPNLLYGLELATARVAAAQHNGSHACVSFKLADGELGTVCWGVNTSDQVSPDPAHPDACVPSATWAIQQSTGLADPSLTSTPRIAVGANHSCQLDSLHQLYCWGGNDNGELGAVGSSGVPKLVHTGTWAEVATSSTHSCGITLDRKSVSCWGLNRYGELGDGARFHPEPVASGLVVP